MPELPEVETVASELRVLLLGKEIVGIEIIWPKSYELRSKRIIHKELIQNISRKGKYLILHLSHSFLIIHLRMTGQLLYVNGEDSCNADHVRVKIEFSDKSALHFRDVRKFGRIIQVDDPQQILKKVGIDALDPDFTVDIFNRILKSKKMGIKAFLLTQNYISGIGNIYADESLFRTGIHPSTLTHKIPALKIGLLYENIRRVLHEALQNMGSTISDYRDSFGNSGQNQNFLMVYRRKGEPCFLCQKPITKKTIAGRGTHFCTNCQKIYR